MLTLKRLKRDYPWNPVYLILRGSSTLGMLENICGIWKAYSGSEFSCKLLSEYRNRRAALDAVVKAAERL